METLTEEAIKQDALTLVEQSKTIVISDQGSYDFACSLLTERIKPFRKQCREFFDSMREPAYRAYQAIMDRYKEADGPLEKAEKQVKDAIRNWAQEQERILQELQRKAEEEARQAEEEERLQVASLAEASGATAEEVNAIVDTPSVAVAAPVAATYQKASGISSRDNWKCRVTNMKELCKAIGAGKVPVTYVVPNESALNARAKADRATINIPGVIAYNDPVVSGRSR